MQQNQKQKSLNCFRKAFKFWKTNHDTKNQADMLLRIGEVHRYSVAMDGLLLNAGPGIKYYKQAINLLAPDIQRFSRLAGKCYASLGYMYYWLNEPELAKKHGEQGLTLFDEPETDWSYETTKQHLGRACVGMGECDKAYELLSDSLQAAVLQAPYYRVRSLWSLSELYFSIGEKDTGLEYATQAHHICQQFNFAGQQQILIKILNKHHIPLSQLHSS